MVSGGISPSAAPRSLLRNHRGGHAAVSYLELFFDLVYVFAITQISHLIIAHMGWQGLIEAAVMFAAVWWAWIYTTWAANWLDPERAPVRIVLLLVMFGSLLIAVALPDAFDGGALLFAGAYVAIQVGRTLFLAWALSRAEGESGLNMLRAALWFVASGAFWIAGALAGDHQARLILWLVALGIEYAGPFALFRVPFLGSSKVSDWTISGPHMAERAALFIIVALGEGIVVTGRTFADHAMTASNVTAFLIAFTGSVLMWWIYFALGAKRGAELIAHHAEPGRVARSAYTYLHMPIVAGIIAGAVADELLLAHPDHHAEWPLIAFQCGGLMIFVGAVGLFKRATSPMGRFPLSHLVGLVLLALAGGWAWAIHVPALLFGATTVAILVLVAAWEWISFNGGWRERFAPRQPA
ncbi:MAG: low temperature requirement protein A [Sphingomonadales bacterium 32-68-7]|nr:MAG: low temperature requirement protein A [Sphingomonadales bacterium 12-68-11]OYX07798.1 MAG: low temperature requirement protein A [Sphingomonadales bacterium 32-68-7]